MLKLGRVVHPHANLLLARPPIGNAPPSALCSSPSFPSPSRVRRPRDAPRRRSVRLHLGLERFHLSLLLSHPSHELVVLLLLRRNLRILGDRLRTSASSPFSDRFVPIVASSPFPPATTNSPPPRARVSLCLQTWPPSWPSPRSSRAVSSSRRAAAHLGGERLRGEIQRPQLILLLSQLLFHLLVADACARASCNSLFNVAISSNASPKRSRSARARLAVSARSRRRPPPGVPFDFLLVDDDAPTPPSSRGLITNPSTSSSRGTSRYTVTHSPYEKSFYTSGTAPSARRRLPPRALSPSPLAISGRTTWKYIARETRVHTPATPARRRRVRRRQSSNVVVGRRRRAAASRRRPSSRVIHRPVSPPANANAPDSCLDTVRDTPRIETSFRLSRARSFPHDDVEETTLCNHTEDERFVTGSRRRAEDDDEDEDEEDAMDETRVLRRRVSVGGASARDDSRRR